MFSKNKDLVSGVLLFAAGLAFFLLSYQIRLSNIDRLVGSRLFPQAGAALLMLLSLGLILGHFFKPKPASAAPQKHHEQGAKPVYGNTVLVLFSFAAYIWLLDIAGFIVSTLAYLFTQMILLKGGKVGGRTLLFYAVLTIASTLAIYYMFNNFFYLLLPRGKLF